MSRHLETMDATSYHALLERIRAKPFPFTSPAPVEYRNSSGNTPVQTINRANDEASWTMQYRRRNWPNTDDMQSCHVPLDDNQVIWDEVPEGWTPVRINDQWGW